MSSEGAASEKQAKKRPRGLPFPVREWHTMTWGAYLRHNPSLLLDLSVSVVLIAILITIGYTDRDYLTLLAGIGISILGLIVLAYVQRIVHRTLVYIVPIPDYKVQYQNIERLAAKIMRDAGYSVEVPEFSLFGQIGKLTAGDCKINMRVGDDDPQNYVFEFRMLADMPEHVLDHVKSSFANGIGVMHTERRFSDIVEDYGGDDEEMPNDAKLTFDLPWLYEKWEIVYTLTTPTYRKRDVYSTKRASREGFMLHQEYDEDLSSSRSVMPVVYFAWESEFSSFVLARDASGKIKAPPHGISGGFQDITTPMGVMRCMNMKNSADIPCSFCKAVKGKRKCILCDDRGMNHYEGEFWYHHLSGILVKSVSSANGRDPVTTELASAEPLSILTEAP